ncbi:MAG: hypothetical protein ACJ73E_01265 [Mycobacteriales bacterium]
MALSVLIGPLAGVGSAGSPVVTADSSLAPGLVTSGRTALYGASWRNDSNATLTNAVARVGLPAGSSLLSSTPAGCVAPPPAGPADPLLVSCPFPNLASGDVAALELLVAVPRAAARTDSVVPAVLAAKEAGSDRNRSHVDTFPAPDRTLAVVPEGGDEAGSCLRAGDALLQTRPGLTPANPLITSARVTGPSGLTCAGLTMVEQHRSDPGQACAPGASCAVDISVTEAPASTSPYQLTFAFLAMNKNLAWYKNGVQVAECAGATGLPSGVDACVNSRAKTGSGSVTIGVLWAGGPDPSWTG